MSTSPRIALIHALAHSVAPINAALAQALCERRIAGAGLDVFEGEPALHPEDAGPGNRIHVDDLVAAILLGLPEDALQFDPAAGAEVGVCVVANDNNAGNIVISGDKAAVDRANLFGEAGKAADVVGVERLVAQPVEEGRIAAAAPSGQELVERFAREVAEARVIKLGPGSADNGQLFRKPFLGIKRKQRGQQHALRQVAGGRAMPTTPPPNLSTQAPAQVIPVAAPPATPAASGDKVALLSGL